MASRSERSTSTYTATLVDALGTTPVSVWNKLWIGIAWRTLGDLPRALAAHQQAAALNVARPLPAFAWYIAAELCADYWMLADFEQAQRYAVEVLRLRSYDALPQIVLPQPAITAALLNGGLVERAREDLDGNSRLAARLPRFQIGQLHAEALLAAHEGDGHGAGERLRAALMLAERLGLPVEQRQIGLSLARSAG